MCRPPARLRGCGGRPIVSESTIKGKAEISRQLAGTDTVSLHSRLQTHSAPSLNALSVGLQGPRATA